MVNTNTELVYKFICDYIARHGLPPTEREIAESCFLARSSVHAHLMLLEGQGRIKRDRRIARGITLPSKEELKKRADGHQ